MSADRSIATKRLPDTTQDFVLDEHWDRGRALQVGDTTAVPSIAAETKLALVDRSPVICPEPPRRRGRVSLRLVSFAIFVLVPTAVTAWYLFWIAADQYVCEFRFGLRSAEPARIEGGSLLFQSAVPASPASLDSYAVVQYVASRAIVDRLDDQLGLRRMFSAPLADPLARLVLPVSIEELVRYWRSHVDAFYDATDGTIVVTVRAFTAPDALALARAIVAASESLVNDLSARARLDAVTGSREEASHAQQRLQTALARERDFRSRNGLVDPGKTADAVAGLVTRTHTELADARAELATLKAYMRDDAPSVRVMQARIRSLEAQSRAAGNELSPAEDSRRGALPDVIADYDEIESERRLAEAAYQRASEAVDRARMEADRQHVYVATIVPPSLPEQALYPQRLRSLGTVALIAFATWAIGGLIAQSVRDHL